MAERANITPKVLQWARETAKFSISDASAKVKVKESKIKEWESGESQPTIRQAKILANAYQRSFAILFLPDIPNDFQPLQDFRKEGSGELNTSTLFIIREIQQKQAWIREELIEIGAQKLPFVGRYSILNSPEEIAKDILETIEIDPLNYENQVPIKEWIEKSEQKGIFISRTSFIHSYLKIDKDELQGFAIADDYAPFVFVNSADWNAPQLFTLVHELAHIWTATSGISNQISPDILDRDKYHPIELFCNEITANVLMPKNYIETFTQEDFENEKIILDTAKKLGVSTIALLVRARNLNIISNRSYKKLKFNADQAFSEFLEKEEQKKLLQKKKDGGPSFYTLRLNRNGRLFTQSVLDAYNSGRIEPSIASLLLKVKSNQFPKLEKRMYKWAMTK